MELELSLAIALAFYKHYRSSMVLILMLYSPHCFQSLGRHPCCFPAHLPWCSFLDLKNCNSKYYDEVSELTWSVDNSGSSGTKVCPTFGCLTQTFQRLLSKFRNINILFVVTIKMSFLVVKIFQCRKYLRMSNDFSFNSFTVCEGQV